MEVLPTSTARARSSWHPNPLRPLLWQFLEMDRWEVAGRLAVAGLVENRYEQPSRKFSSCARKISENLWSLLVTSKAKLKMRKTLQLRSRLEE